MLTKNYLKNTIAKNHVFQQYAEVLNNKMAIQYIGNTIFNGLSDTDQKQIVDIVKELVIYSNSPLFETKLQTAEKSIMKIIDTNLAKNQMYEREVIFSINNAFKTYVMKPDTQNSR